MRALGMAGKLSLPLLSAAAYVIYSVAAHRGPLGPDLISFLIPFDSNPLPGSRPCRSPQALIDAARGAPPSLHRIGQQRFPSDPRHVTDPEPASWCRSQTAGEKWLEDAKASQKLPPRGGVGYTPRFFEKPMAACTIVTLYPPGV
jgi:hypothetical protein